MKTCVKSKTFGAKYQTIMILRKVEIGKIQKKTRKQKGEKP